MAQTNTGVSDRIPSCWSHSRLLMTLHKWAFQRNSFPESCFRKRFWKKTAIGASMTPGFGSMCPLSGTASKASVTSLHGMRGQLLPIKHKLWAQSTLKNGNKNAKGIRDLRLCRIKLSFKPPVKNPLNETLQVFRCSWYFLQHKEFSEFQAESKKLMFPVF